MLQKLLVLLVLSQSVGGEWDARRRCPPMAAAAADKWMAERRWRDEGRREAERTGLRLHGICDVNGCRGRREVEAGVGVRGEGSFQRTLQELGFRSSKCDIATRERSQI